MYVCVYYRFVLFTKLTHSMSRRYHVYIYIEREADRLMNVKIVAVTNCSFIEISPLARGDFWAHTAIAQSAIAHRLLKSFNNNSPD